MVYEAPFPAGPSGPGSSMTVLAWLVAASPIAHTCGWHDRHRLQCGAPRTSVFFPRHHLVPVALGLELPVQGSVKRAGL